jgi:hypothetical protein
MTGTLSDPGVLRQEVSRKRKHDHRCGTLSIFFYQGNIHKDTEFSSAFLSYRLKVTTIDMCRCIG